MKKTAAKKPRPPVEDLDHEYRFDYRRAKPNRFADHSAGTRMVVLDEDVARVFTTQESVNAVLRAYWRRCHRLRGLSSGV
jgi:hypothetical protein